jgi:hypothetical protein
MELNMNTVEGLAGFIQHVFQQRPTPERKAMAKEIIDKKLRPVIAQVEQADTRCDYAAMLGIPVQYHKLLGKWIDISSTAFTWNVLVSPDPVAQEVRDAFFPTSAPTTLMAVGGAVWRLMRGHDDDSQQTADLVEFMRLDDKRDYDNMLTLCSSGKFVKDFWHVMTGHNIKKWHLIEDDAEDVAKAVAVGDVVFVS